MNSNEINDLTFKSDRLLGSSKEYCIVAIRTHLELLGLRHSRD